MKNNIRYTLAAIAGIMAAGVLSSCEETYAEKDKGATPEIKYARTCDIEQADSLVTHPWLHGMPSSFIAFSHGCFLSSSDTEKISSPLS